MDLGAAETDEQREATYRFLNDEISAQHARLLEVARETDTKATVVAGFAAAAISFLLDTPRGTRWWMAFTCYGAAFATALATMWPRRWAELTPFRLHVELADAKPVFAVGRVAGSKVAVFERNQAKVGHKAVLWVVSVLLLAGGTVLSVWSAISEVGR